MKSLEDLIQPGKQLCIRKHSAPGMSGYSCTIREIPECEESFSWGEAGHSEKPLCAVNNFVALQNGIGVFRETSEFKELTLTGDQVQKVKAALNGLKVDKYGDVIVTCSLSAKVDDALAIIGAQR